MKIPENNDDSEAAVKALDFRREAVGYIEDELHQGYGLDQIRKELLDEGYPEEMIESAVKQVEAENKVSQKDKEKVVEKSDEGHMKRRFHLPVLAIAGVIILVLLLMFLIGSGEEEKGRVESIDTLLYEDLGITMDYRIAGSQQTYSRDEMVDSRRAEGLLIASKDNKLMSNLKLSDAVKGFNKRSTVFNLIKAGVEERTLVELRFQALKDLDTLKIVESIPKSTATYEEILLTQGGVVAEKDPVLVFTFNDVKQGDVLKAVYVVKKRISDPESLTFAAEEKEQRLVLKQDLKCGDGNCVVGESYVTCCTDCGCLPKFKCESNRCVAEPKDQCKDNWDCDDGDASTRDTCEGSPKKCSNSAITGCEDGDMYCPPGCDYDTDNDCEPPAAEEAGEGEAVITGPQESPRISEVSIKPETADIGKEITITAKVTDANGKDDIQRVWFEVLELVQTKGEQGEMNDDGEDGDAAAGDGIYTGKRAIAEYYLKGSYHLTVFAKDSAGNQKKFQKMFRVIGGAGAAEVADCGTDLDCFIDAADDCSPAKVTNTITLSQEGMTETDIEHYEIRGEESGKCRFHIQTERIDVAFTEEMVQQMIDEGYTQEEVDAELESINEEADQYEGDEGECLFNTNDLVAMLNRWKQGNIYFSDFDVATCEGAYFS
jgi:hypothetical protein